MMQQTLLSLMAFSFLTLVGWACHSTASQPLAAASPTLSPWSPEQLVACDDRGSGRCQIFRGTGRRQILT